MATVWRLVTHHERKEENLDLYKERGLIAIGWSRIGEIQPEWTADLIKQKVWDEHNAKGMHLPNWPFSGRQLFAFVHEMKEGDFVILSTGQRRCVMRLTGEPYRFSTGWEPNEDTYGHRRGAELTSLNADDIWQRAGGIELGWNQRWTLVRCTKEVDL